MSEKKDTQHPPARSSYEIGNEHVGEYVLMEVTGRDEEGSALGYLMEVGPSAEHFYPRLDELHAQYPERRYLVLRGKRAVRIMA